MKTVRDGLEEKKKQREKEVSLFSNSLLYAKATTWRIKKKKKEKERMIRIPLLFPAYLPLIDEMKTIHIFLYTHLINNKRTYAKKTKKKRERARARERERKRKKNRRKPMTMD